jgi:hypothetical protein
MYLLASIIDTFTDFIRAKRKISTELKKINCLFGESGYILFVIGKDSCIPKRRL